MIQNDRSNGRSISLGFLSLSFLLSRVLITSSVIIGFILSLTSLARDGLESVSERDLTTA